jgi:hypothetical protein
VGVGASMNLVQIEYRALRALEHWRKGTHPEDDLVELKRDLPSEHQSAARRIAAMANSARGETFIWVVGGHPDGAHAPLTQDLADWWPQIESWFDGDAPVMQSTHTLKTR